jgi:hypothetical protein
MTPKKFAIALIVWLIWFLCLLGGIFMAGGIAVYFFSGGEYGHLAAIQDRSQPAFWICLGLLAPCMLVGAAGAFTAIVLPAYCVFRIPMRRKGRPIGWLEAYLKAVSRMLQDEW